MTPLRHGTRLQFPTYAPRTPNAFPGHLRVPPRRLRAQPGSLADCMLHETAVSWLRKLLERSVPTAAWKEPPEQYYARLRKQCEEVNAQRDVDGLCREFHDRLAKVVAMRGAELKK